MARIGEKELILPSLYAMFLAGGAIKTSDLIVKLTEILKPTGEDMEILDGRKDTKFSQKVRNLKSHETLEKKGFSKYVDGRYELTDIGRKLIDENKVHLSILFEFSINEVTHELRQLAVGAPVEVIDEKIVAEGELRTRTQEYRTRSRELREAAVEHYSLDGRIMCNACDFEFALAYPKLGNGYIQIHHLRPVSYLRGEKLEISRALQNVCPLCANCHQMVHRDNPPMAISKLQKILKVNYQYR